MLTALKNSHFSQATIEFSVSSLLSLFGMSLPIPGFFCVPTLLIPTTGSHSPGRPQFSPYVSAGLGSSQSSICSDQMGNGYLTVLARNIVWILNHFWESHESRSPHECTQAVLYAISEGPLIPGNLSAESYPTSKVKTAGVESQVAESYLTSVFSAHTALGWQIAIEKWTYFHHSVHKIALQFPEICWKLSGMIYEGLQWYFYHRFLLLLKRRGIVHCKLEMAHYSPSFRKCLMRLFQHQLLDMLMLLTFL